MQWSAYSRVGIVNNGAHNALFVNLPLLICVVKNLIAISQLFNGTKEKKPMRSRIQLLCLCGAFTRCSFTSAVTYEAKDVNMTGTKHG